MIYEQAPLSGWPGSLRQPGPMEALTDPRRFPGSLMESPGCSNHNNSRDPMFCPRATSSLKSLAKPSFGGQVRGFCRRLADDGRPTPTTWRGMPRPSKFFSEQHQNPSLSRPDQRTFSSKMAANKDYRLLCLENPLLGMYLVIFSFV